MNILFLGNNWLGSDARAMAEGLRKAGNAVYTVDETGYELAAASFVGKVCRRLLRPLSVREYNDEVLRQYKNIKPDLVVVFKGFLLDYKTIIKIKSFGGKIIQFYPDTSLQDYTSRIDKCVKHYDIFFTTKSFMVDQLYKQYGCSNGIYLPHAADNDLHRVVSYDSSMASLFTSDVSFVGAHTLSKEQVLSSLVARVPAINLAIWGPYWDNVKTKNLNKYIKHYAPFGDLYVNAINYTKINIALLCKGLSHSVSGDLITARTFQIPACGAFMLHERTKDLLDVYQEGKEVACFDSVDELAEKIQYYLAHDNERKQIAEAGYSKTIAEHTWVQRAKQVVEICKERGIVK